MPIDSSNVKFHWYPNDTHSDLRESIDRLTEAVTALTAQLSSKPNSDLRDDTIRAFSRIINTAIDS